MAKKYFKEWWYEVHPSKEEIIINIEECSGKWKSVATLSECPTENMTDEEIEVKYMNILYETLENCGYESIYKNNSKEIDLAKCYYAILKEYATISNIKGQSLEGLCNELNGINFDGELFDVNFGNICATIIHKNDKTYLSPSIEIWSSEDCITEDYKME